MSVCSHTQSTCSAPATAVTTPVSPLHTNLQAVNCKGANSHARPCMPAAALLCFTGFCTIRLKIFPLFFVFIFYVCICDKYQKLVSMQLIVFVGVSRLTLLDLQKKKKIGLMNLLLELSSFIYRALIVFLKFMETGSRMVGLDDQGQGRGSPC